MVLDILLINKKSWHDFVCFLRRKPEISLRKPQDVAINRVYGLNKEAVNLYFDNFKSLLQEHNFQPCKIYNLDESGVSCANRPIKVLATKGKHCVSSMTCGEKGVTTTVVMAISATRHYVPPLMIFKRKRMKPELLDHIPAGTIGACSENGWVNTEIFMTYIQHFVQHTHWANPILMIFNGHKSHTRDLELIEYARANGSYLLSLPPHTSHKLQPLARSYFKSLKSAFNATCTGWTQNSTVRWII